jgi:hypothetical protein
MILLICCNSIFRGSVMVQLPIFNIEHAIAFIVSPVHPKFCDRGHIVWKYQHTQFCAPVGHDYRPLLAESSPSFRPIFTDLSVRY